MFETLQERRSFGGIQGVYRHPSEACGGPMDVAIYKPPQASEQAVPVVYYLSGLTCTPMNVTEKSGFQRAASEFGIMVVAPDTSPRGAGFEGEDDHWDFGTGAGFYVDATRQPWRQRYRMYSYVTEELPRLVDATFPSLGPRHRGIMGHSMGGHGALVAALRQPDAWRSVSAFAPICAPSRCPWGEKAFGGYLGDDREQWKEYDASELVGRRHHPATILIDQGLEDDFLTNQLMPEAFETACDDAGQDLELRRHQGYDHSYYFIASFMADHLQHHAELLR